MLIFEEIFYQNYSLKEDGIPPHWAVRYRKGGYADYYYCDTHEEAVKWAKENCYGFED